MADEQAAFVDTKKRAMMVNKSEKQIMHVSFTNQSDSQDSKEQENKTTSFKIVKNSEGSNDSDTEMKKESKDKVGLFGETELAGYSEKILGQLDNRDLNNLSMREDQFSRLQSN